MVDSRLSKLLRTQVRGAVDDFGYSFAFTNLIPVNYPWVGLYLTNEARWVHLFPWLKDTQVEEQLDLYSFMPPEYDNAFKWARAYMYGDANILSLNPEDDSPLILYPKSLQKMLRENAPGISLDDIGTRAWNRRNYHARWGDFPVPTSLVTTNIAVESLGSSTITNVAPALTNIFNTVSVEISSFADPNKKVFSGEMRVAELHNRRLVAWHTKVATNNHTLTLSLAAFRTNIAVTKAFASASLFNSTNTNAIVNLTTNVSLAATDEDLKLTVVHKRHRSLPGSFSTPDYWTPYLGYYGSLAVTNVRTLRKGDLAAINLNVGRATRKMLDQHAVEIWNMERTGTAGTMDRYQGSVAYLMGMSFFEKRSRFLDLIARLHKVQPIALFGSGLAMLRAKRDTNDELPNGDIILVQPVLDMLSEEVAVIGNRTLHLDSGDDGYGPDDRMFELGIVGGSALEHNVLNRFFQQSDSISTVRLLQLAQKSAGIVTLQRFNYLTEGEKIPPGSTNKLKEADPIIWSSITNTFATAYTSNNVQAFVTPGKISNSSGTYHGMGAMVFGAVTFQALIADGLNGGYAPPLDDAALAANNIANVSVTVGQDNTPTFSTDPLVDADEGLTSKAVATHDVPDMVDNITATTETNPGQDEQLDVFHDQSLDTATDKKTLTENLVDAGAAAKGYNGNDSEFVQDPVNAITGEFYIDTVDLRLPGPMPLDIRRNYSSQNVFDGDFGPGWKLSYMPFLSVSKDGTTNSLIYSAEVDGSVIAYRRQTNGSGVLINVWKPVPKDNPRLQNLVGSVGNLFNSSITRTNSGTITNYTLRSADGGTRIYYATNFTIGSGGAAIARNRPYLDTWQDSRGNYLKFFYGRTNGLPNFGKVRRVESSSGNFVGFNYDIYGHVTEAWTGDGRRLIYEYDDFGDLVKVRLPDASEITYAYEHAGRATNSTWQVYSKHLITREEKPEGRIVANDYDQHRRVIHQYSTVGTDLRLVRNASFFYSNNFAFTNSTTNLIHGATLISDYLTNVTRYEYTNSLMTRTLDPLGRETRQVWYLAGDSSPGAYPGSLKTSVDRRGLVTEFRYDSDGNATNVTTVGDLTGAGNTNESAIQLFAYNTNRLATNIVDAVGNRTVFTYTNSLSPFLRTSDERYASNGTLITATVVDYYNVTNSVIVNNYKGALGLPRRSIRAFGSADAATNELSHDAHGFITNEVRFTGTADPTVSLNYFYNLRSELVETRDAAGRRTVLSYNARGNVQSREVFDEQGTRLSGEFSYYNQNGELTWHDGPRSDPEDYTWFEYDGAGRKTQEVRFRSRGREDATGVEAEAGDALYATTFFEYDPFNNLVKVIDPRGHYQRMTYDAVGQLIGRRSYDGTTGTNATPLATEGFAYEPGGLVTRQTNALGSVSETLYTSTGQPRFRRNPDGSTNGWLYYLDGRPRREILNNGSHGETAFDDAARRTTRTFRNAGGSGLATNVVEFDRRGNTIRRVDAGGFLYTNVFDALDRLKVAMGPRIVATNPPGAPPLPGSPPSPVQEVITNFFDAAGVFTTNVNALGEKSITRRDALGRTMSLEILSASGARVRYATNEYAANHHSHTVYEGSGTNTIPTIYFTDNDGRNILTFRYPTYPTGDLIEFTWQGYDLAGNRTQLKECSWSNFVVTVWSTNLWTFDGLNRVKTATVGDGATTTFSYNAAGNVTNRVMPGNLQWRALYNSAGQMTEEKNIGTDSSTARLTSYSYYSAGSPYAGRLQTRTDGRNVTCTYGYDEWLRPATNTHAGSLDEHNLTTAWQYDARGLVTNITENFASTNTGPGTIIRRGYTAYGQMSGENIYSGSEWLANASQKWDSAGRRISLGFGSAGYNYGWYADGRLASTAAGYGIAIAAGSYSYTDAGLLTSRIVGSRVTTITSRDGVGRPLGINTTITNSAKLTETLTWRPDGLRASHTLQREDFTDSRSFAYADGSRRLIEERLGLSATKGWTNAFAYDGGTAGGPGVLTKAGSPSSSSAQWTGGKDAFLRIATETNTVTRRQAHGRVNGSNGFATVRALLDGTPQAVATVATGNTNWPTQWRATLELFPGAHQLTASAVHPSGLFTTNATIWFTNTAAYDVVTDGFDGGGYQTNRVWKQGANIVRSQVLRWDARGRLLQVSDRLIDRTNGVAVATNGVDFIALYDAFDRLLRTVETPVVASVTNTSSRLTIDHYYDPEHEFLELGVSENGRVTWKVMGPDLDGVFGGQNGTGGFEAIVPGPELFCPIISDASGNLHAVFDPKHSALMWYASRLAGYGAVPGHSPVPLGQVGQELGSKYAWRNRAMNVIGLMWLGGNWYDPASGQFLSPDPAGHAGSPSLYSFCHGDPINFWDADGRLAKQLAGLDPFTQGRESFGIRLRIIQELAGAGADASYAFYGMERPQQRSFAEKAGDFAFDAVLNSELIQESWHELNNSDFSSAAGVATFFTAGAGIVVGPIDAAVNVVTLGGKGAVQGGIKAGLREAVGVGAKEASQSVVNRTALFTSSELAGVERASQELIRAVGERRAITWATEGSDTRRYLDYKQAEAAAFPASGDIFLRPDPSKAAVLEEFLHGTQSRLGVMDRLGRDATEAHVKSFMIRHQRMLGLSDEDVRRLIELKRRGL